MFRHPRRRAALAAILFLLAGIQLSATGQEPAPKAKGKEPKAESKESKAEGKEPKAESKESKPDLYGDPLPAGAALRLGTVRLRHGEPVSLVAFLQESKALLTVAGDGVVRIWDVANGKELRRFRIIPEQSGDNMMMGRGMAFVGGAAMVFTSFNQGGLTLAADGKTLALTGMDGALHLWDTTAGKELRKIDNIHADGGVSETLFSPDCKTLAVRGYDSSIRLFDVATVKKVRTLGKKPENGQNIFWGGGYGNGSGMAFSPDGKTLVTATGENANAKQLFHLIAYDTATGNETRRITNEDQNGYPMSPKFTPDGRSLIWTKWDGSIQVAEAATGKIIHQHKGQGYYGGSDGLLTADGQTLITRGNNSGLRLTDVATGKATQKFEQPATQNQFWGFYNNGRGGLALSSDGKLVALASENHTVRLLDLAANKEREFGDGHRSAVARVSYPADGKTLFTQGQDGTLCVWDAATGKKQRQFKAPTGAHHFALSPDGKLLLAAHADNSVHVHDATNLNKLRKLEGAKDGVGSLAFTADGKTAAVYGAADKGAFIWLYDVATGKQRQRIKLPMAAPDNNGNFAVPMAAVAGLSFSPDGRLVTATIDPHTLGLWDATTGKELPPIHAPGQRAIQGAVFTPDGRCIALDLFGEDTLRLWEIASGKERRQYGKKPTARDVNSGAGMMFMGGGFNGGVMMPFTRPAAGAAFSPDGRLVAHSRANHAISVWDVTTGKELGQLKGHQGAVDALTFAPDGKTLATGSRDTTGLVWELKGIAPSAKPPEANVNVEARWKELAGDDAAKAFEAILALAGAPVPTAAFLKDHVRPAATADPEKIERLVADLDSDRFAERKQATVELEKIGEAATPFLRKALEGDPSTEVRKRIEDVLKKTDSAMPRGETLRTIRAIEVLESMGSPEAKAVLQTVAKGMSEAAVTRAARAALDRLH